MRCRMTASLRATATLALRRPFRLVSLAPKPSGPTILMHIGMLGTMAQLYLSDLKQKTWRGQLGRCATTTASSSPKCI